MNYVATPAIFSRQTFQLSIMSRIVRHLCRRSGRIKCPSPKYLSNDVHRESCDLCPPSPQYVHIGQIVSLFRPPLPAPVLVSCPLWASHNARRPTTCLCQATAMEPPTSRHRGSSRELKEPWDPPLETRDVSTLIPAAQMCNTASASIACRKEAYIVLNLSADFVLLTNSG